MDTFQSNAARWSLSLGATSMLLILWGLLVFSGDDASALPAIGSRRMLLGSSSWPGDASDASAIASETAVSRTLNTTNIRTYYISIDEVVWDYAPTDNDLCFDRPFTDVELPYVRASETTIGSSYTKAQFRWEAMFTCFDLLMTISFACSLRKWLYSTFKIKATFCGDETGPRALEF
jgi:hypothetical protein